MTVRGVGLDVPVMNGDLAALGTALDALDPLDLDTVELPVFAFDLVAGGRTLREPLDRLLAACRGRRFAWTVHAALGINYLEAPEHLPLHDAVLEAHLDIAEALGAAHVVIHTGFCREDAPDLPERYARQRERLRRAGDEAARRGLVVCVENVFPFGPGLHTALPSRLAEEVEAVGHPNLRANLDVSHGYLCAAAAGVDPFPEVVRLAGVARHVHLHDSFGRPEDLFWAYTPAERMAFGLGDLHLPLGWGSIPFERILSEARFEPGTIVINELAPRHRAEAPWVARETRRLAGLLRTG